MSQKRDRTKLAGKIFAAVMIIILVVYLVFPHQSKEWINEGLLWLQQRIEGLISGAKSWVRT
jgi:hypothetical protein